MKAQLSWRNLAQHPARSLTACSGVSFAILLLFMQLGFRSGCSRNAERVFAPLAFDLALVSPQYVMIKQARWFPRARLEQARGLACVATVAPVYVDYGLYRNPQSRLRYEVLLLGVDPQAETFSDPELADSAPLLAEEDTVLLDRESRPEIGPQATGTRSELNGRRVRLAGRFTLGSGFVAQGAMVLGRKTYEKLVPEASADRVSLGLVRLRPGTPPVEAARQLQEALGADVRVLTRAELEATDVDFLVNVKPVGIMFTAGVVLAFVVGAFTLYQVLATDVADRLSEYAVLKAMGFGDGFVYRVVVEQGLIYTGLGFVPAFGLSLALYWGVRTVARLPVFMTAERVAAVLLITALMCAVSAGLALRRLRNADPADLF